MANIQKYFEQFHETIRIDYDMSEPLREKRDIVLGKIRKYLSEHRLPGFEEILQGSYVMKTGVVPIDELDYDIDVGLRFSFRESEHTAKEVRKWIFDAVEGHTKSVEDRGPCVRVAYDEGYHVDLVTYAVWEDPSYGTQFRLAHKDNGWRPADPVKLIEHVDNAMKSFSETEDNATKTNQFRRVVRYCRRWYDEAIPKVSDDKPSGVAYVLAAAADLKPSKTFTGKPDDLSALQSFAAILSSTQGRIIVKKPTPEYDDVFAKVSDSGMVQFKTRLNDLAIALGTAAREPDPVKACEIVKKQLGRDFHIPDPEHTARKTSAPAIVTSSSSAL